MIHFPFPKDEVMTQRYFIGMDDSGHEYLIPEEHADDWFAFVEDEERLAEGVEPEYAKRIDGGRLTFTDPQIGKFRF